MKKIVIMVATGLLFATGMAACSGADSGAETSSSASASTAPGDGKAADQEAAPPTITYRTADGSAVEIDPTAPLPAPVVEDVKDQVAASYVPGKDASTWYGFEAIVDDLSTATGKSIVLIAPSYGLAKDDDPNLQPYLFWAGVGADLGFATVDQAPQVAAATAWVAEQDAPETYEVIIAPAY